jgi:hypothetical protein
VWEDDGFNIWHMYEFGDTFQVCNRMCSLYSLIHHFLVQCRGWGWRYKFGIHWNVYIYIYTHNSSSGYRDCLDEIRQNTLGISDFIIYLMITSKGWIKPAEKKEIKGWMSRRVFQSSHNCYFYIIIIENMCYYAK